MILVVVLSIYFCLFCSGNKNPKTTRRRVRFNGVGKKKENSLLRTHGHLAIHDSNMILRLFMFCSLFLCPPTLGMLPPCRFRVVDAPSERAALSPGSLFVSPTPTSTLPTPTKDYMIERLSREIAYVTQGNQCRQRSTNSNVLDTGR